MNNIYEKTTDSKGKVILEFDAKPNNYDLLLSFSDSNNNYVKCNKKEKITIKPISTTLNVNDLNYNYDNCTNNYLYATLKDNENNIPLNDKIINFKINNKNISVKTDDNGQARLQINEKPGTYNTEVSFSSSLYSNITKIVKVNVISFNPSVNYDGGFYKKSNLNLTLNVNNANLIKYSWDNETWNYTTKPLVYNLKNGIYDLYYSKENTTIYHQHYVIDNEAPYVWSNYNSDLYDSNIIINLSAWDYIDHSPQIYYTLNGKDPITEGILYEKPFTINDTTTLKFYSIDFNEIKSDVITYNYMFNCEIANLNSGKKFTTIESAINDKDTVNGDIIKIAPGIYSTNLIINKELNLIGNNNGSVQLISANSSEPVIKITSKGNNSVIYGIKIKKSNYGVLLEKSENVTLLYDEFEHCKNSIVCYNDSNTLICNNNISSGLYLSNMTGITSSNSDNLIISDNKIILDSNLNSKGILVTDTGKNISITNNIINNKNSGVGVFIYGENVIMENNSISNFIIGTVINSVNSTFSNNQIYNNGYGLELIVSGYNTYKSNNIFNNLYGVHLGDSFIGAEDKFYLNRLCNNKYFDFYSESYVNYVIDNNWWGTNNPKLSLNNKNYSNIYDEKSSMIINSWVIINSFATSYELDENNIIKRTKIYLETNYNNLGQDLSINGYLPNNLNVIFKYDNNNQKTFLKNGISNVEFNLTDSFKIKDTINISTKFDNQIISFNLNKKALIDTIVFSSAIDTSTNEKVTFNYTTEYSNTTWITYSWAETGLYTGTLYQIVNGKIVKSINITNKYYKEYKDKYRTIVFELIKAFNEMFASTKEGIWSPNDLYLTFAKNMGLAINNKKLVEEEYLKITKKKFKLTNTELEFIKNNSKYFIDNIIMMINYHGEFGKKINFNYENEEKIIKMPQGFAIRESNIYYTNILDENSKSVGYEGMRSFAIAKTNVNNDTLKYWLNQKEFYSPGMMKASYGTFLTSLLVIYENDNIAGQAANELNLTWNRISPTCVSLCNDFNCLYITGESDHTMGREAIGNKSNIWKFNFISSFSFSLIEQLVSNNVWNDTTIGSVTLGLIQSYMKNETLEIFKNNEFIFIKHENENNSILIIDLETGIVRDVFNYYGILGTMPCYHDNITENAWNYGNKLLDDSSKESNELKNIFNIGIIGATLVESAEIVGVGISGAAVGLGIIIILPVVMFLCPDEVNEAWKNFVYLLNPHYKDYPNIPIYETYPTEEPETPPILILNGKSLDEYIISEFKNRRYPNRDPNYNKKTIELHARKDYTDKYGKFPHHLGRGGGDKPNDPDPKNWKEVGKHLKKLYDEFRSLKTNQEKLQFLKSHILEFSTGILTIESSKSIQDIIILIISYYCRENEKKEKI